MFPLARYQGLRITREFGDVTSVVSTEKLRLPLMPNAAGNISNFPRDGGGLAFDLTTRQPFYDNGFQWLPIISGGGGGSTVESWSVFKAIDQSIPPLMDTVLTDWSEAGAVYISLAQWNLATGEYTATVEEDLSITANVSWAEGFTNQGDRYLRVEHLPSGLFVWDIIKEDVTQADPDINMATTQTVSINMHLFAGDKARVTVEHTASINIDVESGSRSTLCGFRIT